MKRFKRYDDQALFNEVGKEMNERFKYKYGSGALTDTMIEIAINVSPGHSFNQVKDYVLASIIQENDRRVRGLTSYYSSVIKDYEIIFNELYDEVSRIMES